MILLWWWYQTVIDLGKRFEHEQKVKSELRDMLLRQQNMLNLILCHFLYTGQREESEFQEKKKSLEDKLGKIESEIKEHKDQMQKYGEVIVDVRLAVLSIIERFDDPAKKKKRFGNMDLMSQLKIAKGEYIPPNFKCIYCYLSSGFSDQLNGVKKKIRAKYQNATLYFIG